MGLERLEIEYDNSEDDSQIMLNITKVKINDVVYDNLDFDITEITEIEDGILDITQLDKLLDALSIFLYSDCESETETLVITKDDINCFNLI